MSRYLFEKLLSLSKTFILLPVLFGVFGAFILFIVATIDMVAMLSEVLIAFLHLTVPSTLHTDLVSDIITAVDLYLIAVVLLIFSFGLYELFITDEDSPRSRLKMPPILDISSLDELKDKLAKVIVLVLVVSFFQRVIYIKYQGALEMMYFALSISALSVGVYLLHKDAVFKKKPKPHHHRHPHPPAQKK